MNLMKQKPRPATDAALDEKDGGEPESLRTPKTTKPEKKAKPGKTTRFGKKHRSADESSAEKRPKAEKKRSLDDLEREAVNAYNLEHARLSELGSALHLERIRSIEATETVTALINSIAARPKTFDTDLVEVSNSTVFLIDEQTRAVELLHDRVAAAFGVGAGAAAGTATAALAPSTAMWVATTFGTASTGTAISTLSGAAAESAALAWLGGGALSAGGAGTAGGSALLALSGPIGWTVAGIGILAAIGLYVGKTFKKTKKRREMIGQIEKNRSQVRRAADDIAALLERTSRALALVKTTYTECLPSFGANFDVLEEPARARLGALVNETTTLGALLKETIADTDSGEPDPGSATEDAHDDTAPTD